MKVLVAIESCHSHKNRRDWQRQTWLPKLQFDYKFFVGKDESGASKAAVNAEEDVVVLDCKDDYNSLPNKTLAIVRWAREHGYDKLLKLDDDVYCRPERLVVPDGDYVGHCYGHKYYCSGAAYWLSRYSMDAIHSGWKQFSNAEDMSVGQTLAKAGISLTEDHRYRIGWKSFPKDEGENEFPHPDNDTITFHMYFPDFMVSMDANWDKQKQLVDATHFNSLRNRYQ